MKFEKIKSIKRISVEETSDLVVEKNHNFIANDFVVHNSGWGKGLAAESLIEEYHRAGYVVMCLADPKKEWEMGYAQFLPKERYHLSHLKKIGKLPEKKQVKLYHPFTFALDQKKYPEINFYTISLKMLGRKEWSMIAETGLESDTIRLLLNASANIGDSDGLYGFLHYLEGIILGKVDSKKTYRDPKNFLLRTRSGTSKGIKDISNYLQPFKKDYFLAPQNSDFNLDWKTILTDQKHYHVFNSYWIKDDKIREFCILYLFNKIIENKAFAKKPILVFIPEIRSLTPFNPEGYKKFLAVGIKENLSMMRSMGKGMSAILDSQVYSDVDEAVRNSATVTMLGELGGIGDAEKVGKALRYAKSLKMQLTKMEYPNSYLLVGDEGLSGFTPWFPSHGHCEPEYSFFEQYNGDEDCSKKVRSYGKLIETMKKQFIKEEEKFKDKIKKQIKEEKEKNEAKRKSEEKKLGIVQKADDKLEKAKKIESQSKRELMRLIYEAKQENPEMSLRDLGKKFSIHHSSIDTYLRQYKKTLEEEKNN